MAIEIISVHIRKCAGISFRNSLTREYGAALSVQYPGIIQEEIGEQTRVIHGHIQAGIYRERFPGAKLITWMRNPIERYLSRYFYLKYHIAYNKKRSNNPLHGQVMTGKASFRDFIEQVDSGHKASWYLEGSNLKEYLFVGIVEHYNQELEVLAKMLGWAPDHQPIYYNQTLGFVEQYCPEDIESYRNYKISADDRKFFNQAYEEENELYLIALKLREKRVKLGQTG